MRGEVEEAGEGYAPEGGGRVMKGFDWFCVGAVTVSLLFFAAKLLHTIP